MNIDIRKSIHDNFKDANEITLPGLGVFLELLWENSDESSREYIISTIKKGI